MNAVLHHNVVLEESSLVGMHSWAVRSQTGEGGLCEVLNMGRRPCATPMLAALNVVPSIATVLMRMRGTGRSAPQLVAERRAFSSYSSSCIAAWSKADRIGDPRPPISRFNMAARLALQLSFLSLPTSSLLGKF